MLKMYLMKSYITCSRKKVPNCKTYKVRLNKMIKWLKRNRHLKISCLCLVANLRRNLRKRNQITTPQKDQEKKEWIHLKIKAKRNLPKLKIIVLKNLRKAKKKLRNFGAN